MVILALAVSGLAAIYVLAYVLHGPEYALVHTASVAVAMVVGCLIVWAVYR